MIYETSQYGTSHGRACYRACATARLIGALGIMGLGACGGGSNGSSSNPQPQPPANQPPSAAFSVDVANGIAPLAVSFDGAASADSDGSISSFEWDFGDDSTDTGTSVSHTFDAPGTYTVTLVVTDDDNDTDSTTSSVRARGAELSGTIQILSSSAVDSDVNDRFSAQASNNDFNTAQAIPNPVRLGGFVNLPGTPDEPDAFGDVGLGALFDSGDLIDRYSVDLVGTEQIVLTTATPDAVLDLTLYDDSRTPVDADMGTGSTKTLPAPGAGRYFIEVAPAEEAAGNVAGASNYVLSVGQGLGTNVSTRNESTRRLSDDFIPGELIVRPSGWAKPTIDGHARSVIEKFGLQERGRAGNTRLLAMDLTNVALPLHDHVPERLKAKYRTLLMARQLATHPDIDVVDVNYRRYPQAQPNDEFYGSQWHYPIINLPQAWDISTGDTLTPGNQVIVAVVDTGVLPSHPDLQGQLVPGYDFISDPDTARDGDGLDGDPTDEGDLSYGGSSSFHGTHVAGTVAARSDNQLGVAGVAWGAKVMPIRALGVEGGSSFDVMQGVAFAAGLDNNSGTSPAQRADIINLSLGSEFSSNVEEAFLRDEVICKDVPMTVICPRIIVIASAGNENSTEPSYPAAYDGVISVAATTISNARASYSNRGPTVDVAAPGGSNATDVNGDGIGDGVISTLADDSDADELQFGYAALNGTSMAAPHVAGVAALMKDVYPGLTADEFEDSLMADLLTDDLGETGRDDVFGYGLINAQKALLQAIALAGGNGVQLPPTLSGSVGSLNFGTFTDNLVISIRNVVEGSIALSGVTTDQSWVSVDPAGGTTIPDSQALSFDVNVDRSNLNDGSYSANLTFDATNPGIDDLTVTVTMQVSSVVPSASAGLHYIILVDAAGASAVPAQMTTPNNGVYTFTLRDVPIGSYEIVAGSDMDDDSFLCDAGEACGAYQTLDAPTMINVDANTQEFMTDLDFVSEFRAVITSPSAAPSDSGAAATQRVQSITNAGVRYRKDADVGEALEGDAP